MIRLLLDAVYGNPLRTGLPTVAGLVPRYPGQRHDLTELAHRAPVVFHFAGIPVSVPSLLHVIHEPALGANQLAFWWVELLGADDMTVPQMQDLAFRDPRLDFDPICRGCIQLPSSWVPSRTHASRAAKFAASRLISINYRDVTETQFATLLPELPRLFNHGIKPAWTGGRMLPPVHSVDWHPELLSFVGTDLIFTFMGSVRPDNLVAVSSYKPSTTHPTAVKWLCSLLDHPLLSGVRPQVNATMAVTLSCRSLYPDKIIDIGLAIDRYKQHYAGCLIHTAGIRTEATT